MRQNRANRSKKIALSGLLSAVAVLVMLSGGIIPVATFTAPVFASLCLIPITVELGAKTALLAYVAVSLLCLLLVPDQEVVFFFILLTGFYPVVQPHINRIKNRVLRAVPKLILFNAAVAAVYSVLLFLFTSEPLREELAARGWWFWAVLLLLGNFTFLLYDVLVDRIRVIYLYKIRKQLFR